MVVTDILTDTLRVTKGVIRKTKVENMVEAVFLLTAQPFYTFLLFYGQFLSLIRLALLVQVTRPAHCASKTPRGVPLRKG
ncbi:MAG: hypothetical protein BBJ60_06670 [Desulfobacterales bacterium S7086C20]|nr:MAG: hypothetical protein BBJ60_06670 [Desulfobacterales bacterium S7086C20]